MKKTICILLATLLLTIGAVSAYGLGVAPSVVNFKDVLRNKVYYATVSIQNPNDIPIDVSLDIEQYNKWIEYPEIVSVPANGNTNVMMKIRVPKKTPLGDYQTRANARMIIDNNGGIGLGVGVGFDIIFTVTKERIYNGWVDNILTRDVIQGEDLRILVGYANDGNVNNKVIVKTDIKKSGTKVASFRNRFKVKYYSSKTLESNYNTIDLAKGYYKADVKVYLRQRRRLTLLKQKEVSFSVV